MSRRHWFLYVLTPLLASWGIDRITKILVEPKTGVDIYGIVGITVHHNHGALLGLFSDLPAVLRIVSLSTGGAFLIFTFFILQYLLPTRSLKLRSGMSFLMGGIIGNVTDRIVYGYVIDFVFFKIYDWVSPVFNFADAIQWVGYGLVVVALLREGKLLWPEVELRKSYWINPKFQLKYCFMLVGFGLSFFTIAATYSYSYFKVTIYELIGQNSSVTDRFLMPFLLTLLIVTTGFLAVLFLVGLILSHRAAGPLYAFEKFLEDYTEGRYRDLKLRAGDDFKHLEELAKKLNGSKVDAETNDKFRSHTPN